LFSGICDFRMEYLTVDDYYARGSIRKRAMRIARQRGWAGEDGGIKVLPTVLIVLALFVAIWATVAVSGLVFSLLPMLLVGLLTGWAASRLTGARLGVGWTILAGVVGSWLGGALFAAVGVPALLNPFNLVGAVAGAAILITAARLLSRPALTGSARPRLGRPY
jgi:uncharacterized membrane protein YeaQ/YmgE (transglycosylase-associated protein family)